MPATVHVTAAPPLETARLTLRAHRAEDLDESAAMWGDAEVVRHIGGTTSTPEQVWRRLLAYIGHWSLMGYGYWVVRDRQSDRFVGEVGLAEFRRQIEPSLVGTPEMGWVLAPWAHGRGLATEAVRAVLAWSDANLPGTRTVCMIDPGNRASMRVADKCGYRVYAETTYMGDPTRLCERG